MPPSFPTLEATGVAYLRVLAEEGFPVESAARLVEFRLAATDEQFPTIAKVRAARRLWARVLEASGATGEMSLHDVYMIHGARANTSTRRRTGVALRYMPSTSLFDRSLRPVDGQSGVPVNFARRPLWLLKGVDRSGNDFEVGHRR